MRGKLAAWVINCDNGFLMFSFIINSYHFLIRAALHLLRWRPRVLFQFVIRCKVIDSDPGIFYFF